VRVEGQQRHGPSGEALYGEGPVNQLVIVDRKPDVARRVKDDLGRNLDLTCDTLGAPEREQGADLRVLGS
jgi:hypothetical protein